MENYLHILLESAWVASLIPLGQEPTFFAMRAFGGFDMRPAAVVSVIGATCGQMFNWWVGMQLLRLKQKRSITETWDVKASALFNRYGIYLLVFCWVPLGKLLPLIARFLGARPRTAFALIVVGEIFNYGQYLGTVS